MSEEAEIQKVQNKVSRLNITIITDLKRIEEGCKEANERKSNKRYNYIKIC